MRSGRATVAGDRFSTVRPIIEPGSHGMEAAPQDRHRFEKG